MRADTEMGWRVLQYNAGLLLREDDRAARVLTFVFYHCAGVGGIHEQEFGLDFYERTVHGVGYWSVGLGDLDAEAYAGTDNPMAWALDSWMRQRAQGRVELRLRLVERLLRSVRDESYRRLLLDAIRTYFRLNRTEQAEEQRLLDSGAFGEVDDMLNTELGRLEERARREEASRARQQSLLDILESRFGTVPEPVAGRIQQVQNVATLQELIRRAAVAESLEEVEALLGP
jgi:hypothetical protein